MGIVRNREPMFANERCQLVGSLKDTGFTGCGKNRFGEGYGLQPVRYRI
jgi:hypothetical protein